MPVIDLCATCRLPILDRTEAHHTHDPGCPNTGEQMDGDCWCDATVHPWCCDQCQTPT
jgi:hypothetical protein